jgi:hypothetical protein
MDDFIATKLFTFLKNNGIDVIYFITIIGNLFVLSYWKTFKNWKTSRSGSKWIACATVYGAFIFDIVSILRLLKILNI